MLVERGACLDATNDAGHTPLAIAEGVPQLVFRQQPQTASRGRKREPPQKPQIQDPDKSASPGLRYETCTAAFRLSSPWINHSKPRLIRVGPAFPPAHRQVRASEEELAAVVDGLVEIIG